MLSGCSKKLITNLQYFDEPPALNSAYNVHKTIKKDIVTILFLISELEADNDIRENFIKYNNLMELSSLVGKKILNGGNVIKNKNLLCILETVNDISDALKLHADCGRNISMKRISNGGLN